VQSAPGKGSSFKIFLPQVQEQLDPVSSQSLPLPTSPGALTILIVEDDDAVRELASRLLEAAGFRVLAARDGVEALQSATEFGSSLRVLLTDIVLPRMRGSELASRLTLLRPDLKVILMSGYTEHIAQNQNLPSDALFLEKPFTREQLLRTINQALRSDQLVRLA